MRSTFLGISLHLRQIHQFGAAATGGRWNPPFGGGFSIKWRRKLGYLSPVCSNSCLLSSCVISFIRASIYLCLSWSAAAATSPLCCDLPLPSLPSRPALEVPAGLTQPLPRPRPLFPTELPENKLASLVGCSGRDFLLEFVFASILSWKFCHAHAQRRCIYSSFMNMYEQTNLF